VHNDLPAFQQAGAAKRTETVSGWTITIHVHCCHSGLGHLWCTNLFQWVILCWASSRQKPLWNSKEVF